MRRPICCFALMIGAHLGLAAEHESTPLVRVLTNPAQFDKKLLTASGVLGQDTDGRWMLFLDCESARAMATQNALLLRSDEKLRETLVAGKLSYVMASGAFLEGDKVRLSVAGEIMLDALRPYPLLRALSDADKDLNIRCGR